MKRLLALRISALALSVLHLTGARGQSGEQIFVDGPRGSVPLAMALTKAYQVHHPDVGVVFEKGLGIMARMEALLQGQIDIALASNPREIPRTSRHDVVAHEIARTVVVFAVNAAVPVSDLTAKQVCDVYSGRTSNWKALGGPDLAIAAHTRPAGQMDFEVVQSTIQCFKTLRPTDRVKIIARARDMPRELAWTPGAIGITSMSVVDESRGRIRSMTIDGVAPTADTIQGKRYPMVRHSYFVTLSSPTPAVARFLEFVRSAEGGDLIRVNGAMPVK